MRSTPRILLAPLNWGLGHATRCLPIAHALSLSLGAEVHWASDGRALALLRAELPATAAIHELPGYGIRYPTRFASLNMLIAAPGMLRAIRAEGKRLAELHAEYDYDLIVSDNRFGCRLAGVESLILSHQVHLPLRGPSALVGQALNAYFLRRFDGLLIPDAPEEPRLAGSMSAPLPGLPNTYLGALSRFSESETGCTAKVDLDLLIVLSGVEPQRSSLESELLRQLGSGRFGRVIFVRGLPEPSPPATGVGLPAGVEMYDYATTPELATWYRSAGAIVTRPGYTTVMDLAVLGRTALYIPTRGQPEQYVLAKAQRARERGIMQLPRGLNLRAGLTQLSQLAGPQPTSAGSGLMDWIDSLR